MEPRLLDENLIGIAPVDTFDSFIWTDRFRQEGDFEISMSIDNPIVSLLRQNRYLTLKESKHAMIITGLGIHSTAETGNTAIITGLSLESILKYRIIWNPTVLVGNFQDAIEQILNENAINPLDVNGNPDTNRKITRLEFETSDDEAITSLQISAQFNNGETLYKAIADLCFSKDIGFEITLTENGKFCFRLYTGVDRSYGQLVNPYVIFSPKFENIINSDYKESIEPLATVTLVAGETGVGNVRSTVTVTTPDGGGSDLSRREFFTDANDITRNVSDGVVLTEEEYLNKLTQRGLEVLSKNIFLQTFEGQVETTNMIQFKYGRDFFMGDIVQVANEYGHQAKTRVTEVINFQDKSGAKTYPTFSTVAN